MERRSFQQLKKSGITLPASGDVDGDGVPNSMDCEPLNSDKQGWLHDKYAEVKQKLAERKVSKEAYSKAREQELIKVRAQRIEKARVEGTLKGIKEARGERKTDYKVKERLGMAKERSAKLIKGFMSLPGRIPNIPTLNNKNETRTRAYQGVRRTAVKYKIIKGKAYPIASPKTHKVRKVQVRRQPEHFSQSGGMLASDMFYPQSSMKPGRNQGMNILGLSGGKKKGKGRNPGFDMVF